MKEIILFPGIDAIEDAALRARAFQLPEVRARIQETQALLKRLGIDANLNRVMLEPNHPSYQWVSGLIISSVATQVGLFEHYQDQGGKADMLMGVSLGDLARSYCAGVVDFNNLMLGVLEFVGELKDKVGSGGTLHVQSATPMDERRLNLSAYGLTASVYQRDDALLVSGPIDRLEIWEKAYSNAPELQIRNRYPMPIPLHSPLLSDIAHQMSSKIGRRLDFANRRIPMYSTILEREIETDLDLALDVTRNVHRPVRFCQSIRRLVNESIEEIRFVNLGPAPTLLQFIEAIDLDGVRPAFADAFDELTFAVP